MTRDIFAVAGLPTDALPWLVSDLGPAERRALREIVERGDLAMVDGQQFIVAPVSSSTIDALAAFEAEAEDREADPDEAQGDEEATMASATWPVAAARFGCGLRDIEPLRSEPAPNTREGTE